MMMKSVAVTESLFIRTGGGHGTGSDDHDYVVVDVAAFPRAAVAAEVNDDEIEGTNDDDDASYDYCDDFPALEQMKDPRTTEEKAHHPHFQDEAQTVPFEITLSFVVDDDVGSVCPPSITEDEEEDAVTDDDCGGESANTNNISDLSASMNKDVGAGHRCKEGEDKDTKKNCLIHSDGVGETNDQQDTARVTDTSDTVPQATASINPPAVSIVDKQETWKSGTTGTGVTGEDTKGHNKEVSVELPSDVPVVKGTFPESTNPTTVDIKNTNDGAWIETSHTSRQSNKKRRKQMKLAKRAAVTAAAVTKLSNTTGGTISNKVMMINHRGCGGKKVAPMMEMTKAVVGM